MLLLMFHSAFSWPSVASDGLFTIDEEHEWITQRKARGYSPSRAEVVAARAYVNHRCLDNEASSDDASDGLHRLFVNNPVKREEAAEIAQEDVDRVVRAGYLVPAHD